MVDYFAQGAPWGAGVQAIGAGLDGLVVWLDASGGGPSLGSRCPLKICSGHVRVTSHRGILQMSFSQFLGSWQGYLKRSPPNAASPTGKAIKNSSEKNSFLSFMTVQAFCYDIYCQHLFFFTVQILPWWHCNFEGYLLRTIWRRRKTPLKCAHSTSFRRQM